MHPRGFELFEFEFTNPFTGGKITKNRIFVPSRLTDNRYLGDDYIASLHQVGSAALVRAWLEGDWDAIEGAFFDCWSTEKHVVAPFAIPRHWLRFRSMDWGSAAPFSVGWWAVASEDTRLASSGILNASGRDRTNVDEIDGRKSGQPPRGHERSGVTIPRGCLVRYREWYGTGAKLTAEQVAAGIVERETYTDENREDVSYGVLDPSAFAEDGGPSIAERMARSGAVFRPADNKRVSQRGAMGGWDQVRQRLVGDNDGNPMMVFFSTCRDSIRTIPVLQHDPDRPEDLDTDAEDHAADDVRYGCMSRPWRRAAPQPEKPLVDVRVPTMADLVSRHNQSRGAGSRRI
jgi:hypothetical protein